MNAKAAFGFAAALLLVTTQASCGGGGGGAPAGGGGGGGGGGGPVLVETNDVGTVFVASPKVALGADGNGLAVWVQADTASGTSVGSVWANRYTAASGWGTPVQIETAAGNAQRPQVAIDGNGNGLAVWDQSDGALFQHIWANRFTAATGTWGTAVLLETDTTSGAIFPRLGIDASGNATVVWSADLGCWTNRYTAATGRWGTAARIETGTRSAGRPDVGVAASGNAVAVWVQSDGTRDNVWANRYTAGTGWGTAGLIELVNTGGAATPRVAVDASGNALAVWVQSDGTRNNVLSNRFAASTGTWGTAALIELDDTGGAAAPRVAIDGSGNALAVWQHGIDVRFNRYTAAGGWGTSALLETGTVLADGVELAINAAGAAVAAWYQRVGANQNVYTRRYAPGVGWGPVALAESYDGGNAYFPAVAINDSGAVLVAWEQTDPVGGVRHDLWADAY